MERWEPLYHSIFSENPKLVSKLYCSRACLYISLGLILYSYKVKLCSNTITITVTIV